MRPFRRLWRDYLRRYVPGLLLASVLMAIEGGAVGALAWMLRPMFDLVFVGGRSDMIPLVGLGIFALFAVRAATGVWQRVILGRIGVDCTVRMQRDLLHHALALDSGYYGRNAPGLLIERVQGDVRSIESIWMTLLTSFGRDGTALVSLMVVALLTDPVWTLFAVVGAPLLIMPSLVLQRYVRKKAFLLRAIAGGMTTRLDEIFHGIAPIKLNTMEPYQEGRFRAATDRLRRATVRKQAASAGVPAMVDLAIGLGFLAVVLYGGPQIAGGEKTVGDFMAFFTAMTLAFAPLRRIANLSGKWQVLQASLERIHDLMDTAPAVVSPATPAPAPARLDIRFRDVALSYGPSPVLRGVTFDVAEGTTTALVGLSGAGKTTIFNVLTRMVDPERGEVTIGGVALRAMAVEDLRGLFSVVSQEALLFDETLRENVTLGRAVPEDKLKAALEAAHVSEFLAGFPAGLDAPAGPRGTNLSGGQRQRIVIARAILRDAPILLLDEATSALDTQSERLVQDALARLAARRTTLVIAHRLSTVREAGQILVMEGGRIVERGTHETLAAEGGLYAELNATQRGEAPAA